MEKKYSDETRKPKKKIVIKCEYCNGDIDECSCGIS